MRWHPLGKTMGDRGDDVFLNGRFVAATRAAVSVYDRGLLYGDGLFETMRAYRGFIFALHEHLDRLRTSARVLGLPIPDFDWVAVFSELLRRNRLRRHDAWVRLTITRGVAEPSVLPPDVLKPTTIAMARRIDSNSAQLQRRGVAVSLLPFSRSGVLPEHKSLNYLPAVMGKVLAARHATYEGLFVDRDDVLSEGTTSSLFLVENRQLSTAPVNGILPGVTRQLVVELAVGDKIRVAEKEVTSAQLRRSDEAFLTSSIVEIIPIVRVDSSSLGSGRPGPVTRRLQRLYQAAINRDRVSAVGVRS